MSSLCCCRGLLSLFGVRDYPLDVVAKAKLDRAKMNGKKRADYATMSKEGGGEGNGSVVNSEPTLSDVSRTSSVRNAGEKPNRKPSSRRPTRDHGAKKSARSYDDSDSDSSVDSTEENIRVLRESIRRSRSRDTLASIDSNGSRSSARFCENPEIDDERSRSQRSPRLQHFPAPQSPHLLSPYGRASPLAASPLSLSPQMSPVHEGPPDAVVEEQSLKEEGFAASYEDEDRRKAIASPEMQTHEDKSATIFDFPEDLPSIPGTPPLRTGATIGSPKDFRRKATRGPSSSLSTRSHHPVSSPSLKWEVEDAGSVYGGRPSGLQDVDDEEIAIVEEAATVDSDSQSEDGDVSVRGAEPISACGTLDVTVQYSMSEQKLQATVIEAHDLPTKARGGSSIVQVRAVLLPAKKKKYKTKPQHASSPRFAETFKLTRAKPEDLKGLALRLRMYGIGKLKDRPIGEAVIRFDELNLIRDPQLTIQLQLEPRTDINRAGSETSLAVDDFSSSMMSLSHGGSPPEVLLGLSYNPPTGRLCVEIIKGSHFQNLKDAKAPDTFVKLSLLNSACKEMAQSKTTIRRGQPNPVYKETFFFQVALFQLSEVTLMVSVYSKRTLKKKEMIGWVAMGQNSSSDQDEQHWQEMKERKGQQVSRWHSLIDT